MLQDLEANYLRLPDEFTKCRLRVFNIRTRRFLIPISQGDSLVTAVQIAVIGDSSQHPKLANYFEMSAAKKIEEDMDGFTTAAQIDTTPQLLSIQQRFCSDHCQETCALFSSTRQRRTRRG